MATLHEAAATGDMGTMSAMLDEEDLDVNQQDASGQTALHHAARHGEAAAAGLLVECDADVNVTDKQGNTALHVAAKTDKRLVVSCLLWGGADITAQNELGNTVLHECALVNAKDAAFLIIENGRIDIRDVKNKSGQLALDIAVSNQNKEVEETTAQEFTLIESIMAMMPTAP
eukprot:CAMPEP_0178448628 /NCGR_PEP_ID=MMETSP0689_2-20121128/42094_1 /TAXON_ID=160604 /ORGANISM="Amphidinium massartii, Strain CS-259" /LENGTH=172 /DNA_ID=CAMNT_0020073843 /DNA_START=51 /DNA_END=566 /DNA_ORIENTATION=-